MSELIQDLRIIAGTGDLLPLIQELEITITRQNVMPTMKIESSGTADKQPILFHLAASDAAGELRTVMRKVRMLVTEAYPHLNCVNSHPTNVAMWLLLFPDLLNEHPRIEWITNAVHLAVYSGLKAIDSPPERALLGFCEECGRALWVIMESGDTFDERLVKCCNTSSSVRELRTRLRERLSKALVTPAESVGLVYAFTGEEVKSPEAFKKKIKRRLAPSVAYPGGKYYAEDVLKLYAPEAWGKYVGDVTDSGG